MYLIKKVYWNEEDQRIRWTQNPSVALNVNFVYAGNMTEPEFDLLLECLFELFDDRPISLDEFILIWSGS